MPAINMSLAILTHRLSFLKNIPLPDHNVWDSFPFNNAPFCQRFGIPNTEVGLSVPPEGELGDHIKQSIRDEWPSRVPGATRFLRYLDADMRKWFATWKPTESKGKGKGKPSKKEAEKEAQRQRDALEENGAPIDKRQALWGKQAVVADKKDWEWILDQVMGGDAGIQHQLRGLMKEHHCDAETAHQIKRDSVKERAEKLGKPFQEADVQTRTAFDEFWGNAERGIALALFGTGIIRHNVADKKKCRVAKAICFRLFENDVRSLLRAVNSSKDTEDKLETAYKNALADGSVGNFRHMYRLLGEIMRVQRVCGVDLTEDKGSWKEKIDRMMEERGRVLRDGKVVKVNVKSHMVSDEVMDQMMDEYLQILGAKQAQDLVDEPCEPQAEVPDLNGVGDEELWNSQMEVDAGVTQWGKTVLDDLFSLIGVNESNVFGRRGECQKEGMWHQWVGAIETVRRSFTNELGKPGDPTLLADQVGLGKTIQVVLILQIFWHLQTLQQSNPQWPDVGDNVGYAKWPKVLGENKYFMGQKTIPDNPILLLVPRTLVETWTVTFREWLDPRAYCLLEFTGNELTRRSFFTSQSYLNAATRPSRTIIIAHNSTVANEGRRCLHNFGDRNAGEPATGDPSVFTGSLFDRDWLLGVVEEAHAWRNPGCSGDTVITLMSRCAQRLALTATPIHTQSRDLIQLGRILRVAAFLGDKGRVLSQQVKAGLSAELKAWKADSEHTDLRAFLRQMRQEQSGADTDQALSARVEDFILSRKGAIQSFRSFWTSRTVMEEILKEFAGVLIRRDERSRDPSGKPLLDLFPKHTVISWLHLGEKTKSALAKQTSAEDRIEEGWVDLQGFFTRVKQILVHPDLEALLGETARQRDEKKRGVTPSQRSSDSDRIETDVDKFAEQLFPTLESYISNPSEKLDRMIEIVLHHLGEENRMSAALAWSPDSARIPSDVSVSPTESNQPRRKIVIYCHLAASWALAKRVLILKGFLPVLVNGRMSLTARNDAVRRFQAEDGPDIMLLSDVGSTGLNLFRASVCVFVVSCTDFTEGPI